MLTIRNLRSYYGRMQALKGVSLHVEEGEIARTHPSIRKIMLRAAQACAASLIAVHNHPSGDPMPSEQDKLLTRDLVIAGRAMEIRIFDHLIIGDGRYFSFADEGLIEEYEMQAVIMSNKGA